MGDPIEPAETVDAATAIGWLPDRERVHTRLGRLGGNHMVGAYWTRGEVEDAIQSAGRVDLSGPVARSQGYGLAIRMDGGQTCLFVEAAVPESAVRFHHAAPVGGN